MTGFLLVLFVLSVFIPVYTYVIYPLILYILPKKEFEKSDEYMPTVSVLVAAYNEESVIEEKIQNLIKMEYPKNKIEFLIASDGSSDRTVEIASKYADDVKVLDLPRGGKVNALNSMLKEATGEILVFSDANTMYDEKAILKLVRNFKDERVGCVSGQLRYKIDETSGEGARSESSYWKYENFVKVMESKIGKLSGANGAIYAVRATEIDSIRKGIINDDFYVATHVLQNGKAVVLDTEAVAFETPNDDLGSQFKRHIRDGAGHYQAICVFWRLLFPRYGSFVHLSHRVCKWIVPFLMIVAFITNALLVSNKVMAVLMTLQIALYLLMVVHYLLAKKNIQFGVISKMVSIIFYFISVNISLLFGFFRLVSGKQKAVWETQR